MSANHKRILALAVWAAVVLGLAYLKWWPRPLDLGDLHPDEAAFTLRLPQDDVLTRSIDRGMRVSLAVREQTPAPTAPEKPATPPQPAAGATGTSGNKPAAAPAVTSVLYTVAVAHTRVLDRICKAEIQSATRIAVCYAAIAVPVGSMPALLSARDDVSIWVEGKETK